MIQGNDEAKMEQSMKLGLFNGRREVSPEILKGLVAEGLKQKSFTNSAQILNSYNISEESNEVTDGTGEIKKIQCPVLLIHGREDLIVPVKDGEKIERLLDGKGKLKVFEQCGHFPVLHYPDELVSLVDEFISN